MPFDNTIKLEDPAFRTVIHDCIRALNPHTKLISIDFNRIGYDEASRRNPMVMFCTAARGEMMRVKANTFVDLLHNRCAESVFSFL